MYNFTYMGTNMNTRLVKLSALVVAILAMPVQSAIAQSTSSSAKESSAPQRELGPILTRVITPAPKPMPSGPIPGTETPNRMQVGNGNNQPRPVNPCPSCR